ncbi:MAG: hypothetical protein U0263_40925 [Polyangiaceae bacterium]
MLERGEAEASARPLIRMVVEGVEGATVHGIPGDGAVHVRHRAPGAFPDHLERDIEPARSMAQSPSWSAGTLAKCRRALSRTSSLYEA